MSLEPSNLTHDNPRDARRASGVTADGSPLYVCSNCLRHKARAQFDQNEHGRVHDLCLDCERLTKAGVSRRKYMKDRSHITVLSKVCRMCGDERPSDEFWLDGKEKDGLKAICGDCERKRRGYKSAVTAPVFDSFTPASTLQPVLDQAIEERDAMARRVDELQAVVENMQRSQVNQAPRTDLLALNAIETEVRWLRERLEAHEAPPSLAHQTLRRGLVRAARLVGPLAFGVFKWADRCVDADEGGA